MYEALTLALAMHNKPLERKHVTLNHRDTRFLASIDLRNLIDAGKIALTVEELDAYNASKGYTW